MCVEGQKAAAALVVLLVWRLARVVDGMSTYKYFLFTYLLTVKTATIVLPIDSQMLTDLKTSCTESAAVNWRHET